MPRAPKKFVYRWRPSFLRWLGKHGNVRLACEQARVDRVFAYKIRKRDVSFAAAWDEAVALAARTLPNGEEPWLGAWGGAKLVLKKGLNSNAALRREHAQDWNRAVEQRFLKAVARSANIMLACREIGFSTTTAYRRRKLDRKFADAWDEALDNGLADLEWRVMREMGGCYDADTFLPDSNARVSVDSALMLLGMHHRKRTRRYRSEPPPPDMAELTESILRKLRAIRHAAAKRGEACPTCGCSYGEGEPTASQNGEPDAPGETRQRPEPRIRNLW